MWPMDDALCREALTKQRAETLRSYVECRANRDPNSRQKPRFPTYTFD